MRPAHPVALARVWLLILCLTAFVNASCGPSARERALHRAFITVDATREAFLVWDDRTQGEIVEKATSLDAGRVALAEHRDKRNMVALLFEVTYRGLAAAMMEPTEARTAEALKTAAALWQAYREMTGNKD